MHFALTFETECCTSQVNSSKFAYASGKSIVGDLWKNYHAIGLSFLKYTVSTNNRNMPVCSPVLGPIALIGCCLPAGSHLSDLKRDATEYFQPMKLNENHCTLLMLENLAMPEWLSVKCNQSLLDTVICSTEVKNTIHISNNRWRNSIGDNSHCNKQQIQFQTKCLSTKYIPAGTYGKFCLHDNLNIDRDLLHFMNMFDKDNQFPVYFTSQRSPTECLEVHKIHSQYQNTKLKSISKPCSSVQGLTFCLSSKKQFDIESIPNFYMCNSSEIISQALLCNGIADCFDKMDELNCNCSHQSLTQTHRCNVLNVSTTPKFSPPNSAKSVISQIPDTLKQVFLCNNSKVIPLSYMDDGYPDCSGGYDEQHFQTSMMNNTLATNLCENPAEIQCYEGYNRCFSLAKLCLCEIDHLGNLVACRNGYHLTTCDDFICNAAYKCQQSFCIPHEYECNRKWECVNGEDEFYCLFPVRHCAGLLKCANSHICISPFQVCDHVKNCPMGTDEELCVPRFSKCPDYCSCFQLVASCSAMNSTLTQINRNLLKYCTHIHLADSVVTRVYFQQFESAVVAILHSNMQTFCQYLGLHSLQIQILSVDNSTMAKVINSCFKGMKTILMFTLTNLGLKAIEDQAFEDQQKLVSLDLSNNLLTELTQTSICFLSVLKHLNIAYNKLQTFSSNLFHGLTHLSRVQTDYFAVCCSVTTNTITCTAHIAWPSECQDILNKAMTIFLWHWAMILLCFNLACCLYIAIKLNLCVKKATSFEITTLFVCAAGLICGIYLIVMLSASTHYIGIFFTREQYWRGSVLCHIVANLFSIFCIFSPLVLNLAAMSKYLVVKYPFEVKYKAVKRIYYHCASYVILSLSISVFVWCLHYFVQKMNSLETPLCSLIGSVSNVLHVNIFTSIISLYFLIACILIIGMHVLLYKVHGESKQTPLAKSKNQKREKALAIQLSVSSICHFFSWTCPAVVYLLSIVLAEYPMNMLTWTTIAAVPMNSIVSPAIFLVMKLKHHVSCTGQKPKETVT